MKDEDTDICWVNDRNKIFNEKLERFYGKYAAEFKNGFERGTKL